MQSFRDDALTECPACGGQLRKVFGAIGIAFKGSGFYSTDSRDTSSKARTDTKDKPSSAGDKSGTSAGSSSDSGSASGTGSGSGSASGSGSGSGSGDKSSGAAPGKGDSKAAASS